MTRRNAIVIATPTSRCLRPPTSATGLSIDSERLAAEGMPRTQIVVRLGISRNAVASTPPPRSESGAQHRERNVPAAVETSVVAFLQERCGNEGVVRVVRTFHDGDVVRIVRGPLGGLVGVVQGQVSGQMRVRILMELLRRRTQVSVPAQLLEHVA